MVTVIISAKEASNSSASVRKPTGTNLYTVNKELKIYHEGGSPQVIATDGCVFLVGENGSITTVQDSYKVAVDFDSIEDTIDFLNYLKDFDNN